VRRLDSSGKEVWGQNYLNYDVQNFNIEERGSLADVAERQREQYQLNDASTNDGELL
jgi:hypothetical protein